MTKNFSLREFDCSCGCVMPEDVKHNIVKLSSQLQIIRDIVDSPIKVNSGFRCEKYNRHIGGVKRSQHLLGKASDIVVAGLDPYTETHPLFDELMDCGELLQGGLGRYKNFTHYDFRKTRKRNNIKIIQDNYK